MTRFPLHGNLLACTGLLVPPLLWAVNTQLSQILPYAECGLSWPLAGLVSLAFALLSLAAGGWSWHRARRNGTPVPRTSFPLSVDFLGALSGLNALVFAFALALQGASSLVLTGCER